MTSSFSDAFDAPFTFGGKPLKKLSIRDLLPVVERLTEDGRKARMSLIPERATPEIKQKMTAQANIFEAVLDDVSPLIFTPRGAIEIADLIVTKNGLTTEGVIDAMPAGALQYFAAAGSGLYSSQRLREMFPSILTGQPAANAGATENPTQPETPATNP